MRYEATPRPLIEDHYHIRELIENQDKRSQDRQLHRDKAKEAQEREDLIKDSLVFVVTDFYCHKCNEDFKSQTIKEVEIDWTCMTQRIAFYRTKCSKGHWCIRHITDRLKDSFWMNSPQVARDRGKYHNDIIQPFQTGYNLLYGKQK